MCYNIRMINNTQKGGFVQLVLIVVVVIVILSYFGFNLREILNSEIVKNNFFAVWNFLGELWSNYGAPIFYKIFSVLISLIGKFVGGSGIHIPGN